MFKVLVVDLEATCWDDHSVQSGKDSEQVKESEIIEIGCAWLGIEQDGNYQILETEQLLVCPGSSTVSEFCTQLTGHTQEKLEKDGMMLMEACEHLLKKGSDKIAWASFGEYDRNQLQKECNWHNIPYPMGRTHFNIKMIMALLQGRSKGVGLQRAVSMMGLTFEGRNHTGVDDAVNAAKVLGELVKRYRLKEIQ